MRSAPKNIGSRAVAEKVDSRESQSVAQEYSGTNSTLHAYRDDLVRRGLEEMRVGRVLSHEEFVKSLRRKTSATDLG
jgi:hypothetical protein